MALCTRRPCLMESQGEGRPVRVQSGCRRGRRQRVVRAGDALAENGVGCEANRTGHGNGVAEQRGRARGYTALGSQHRDPRKSKRHPHSLMPRGSFQTQQHGENKRVNRTHTDHRRGMVHRGVVRPQREAELVHTDAEKAQVQKCPDIAARKSQLPGGRSFGKRTQP